MKSPTRALRLLLAPAWLTGRGTRPTAAQPPPAEFSTNLTQGATTLDFHFVHHPTRNPDFTVNVQTSAGTNIYAATVGVDVCWSYFNTCGGDLNTLVRHVEQSVMAAPSGNYDASALSSLGLVATGAGTLTAGAVPVEPSEPPTLSVTQTGDTLTLAWPPAYTSFALYVQTNVLAAGLGTNWFPVPGVVSNVVTVPVNRDVPAVFYQLRRP